MTSITERHAALLAAGKLDADPAQAAVVAQLAALEGEIAQHRETRKPSSFGWLFARRDSEVAPFKGLYIHGEVGRGKTMLMDLFFDNSPVVRKRRAHFHEFMSDAHERIFHFRQQSAAEEIKSDAIEQTARAIADEAWLLCFDEFSVTDIADAMILGRLFTHLFSMGVVVVATSNVAPENLYKDGLNRALFLPFIELLKQRMDVVRLDARTDFRLEKLTGVPTWHVPADAAADTALDAAWRSLTGGHDGAPCDLTVKGRKLHVPRAAMGVARFSFSDLCSQPLAAADYLRLAHEFHTLIVSGIPKLDYARRNEAKRFINLIDALYDNGVKLIASAAAEPTDLYKADEGAEAFEFARTASRLIEMRSQSYLGLAHGPQDAKRAAGWDKLVET